MLALSNLGKAYRRYRHPRDRLLETIAPWTGPRHEKIWVLRNVELSVREAESVAIIGHNGAGKSTLLKLVTGTAAPTEGSVRANGRIAAILELGMGFNSEFSGRQNALIASQLMGLKPKEIANAMPGIEAFAEIGEYFDQPLRVYSSGMHVRLAFSVATAIRPDVLIVDEALSVGDVYFQHKCSARIKNFRDCGTTMLLVSHDPSVVRTLCDRAILLDRGMVIKDGPPDTVLDYYNAIIAKREADYQIREVERFAGGRRSIRSGDGRATIQSVDLLDEHGCSIRAIRSDAPALIRVRFEANTDLPPVTVGFLIRDRLGNDVFGTNTHYLETPAVWISRGGRFECDFQIERLALGYGHYSIAVALHEGESHLVNNHDWWEQALVFQIVVPDGPRRIGVANLPVRSTGIVNANAEADR
jgi:lipopolysaccharide transport system ATP-binding protein